MERLSPADASNVAIDAPDQANAFLLAAVLGPGGAVDRTGAIDLELLRSELARRLPAVPRLSQRIHRVGRTLVWQTREIDLEQHVRLSARIEGLSELEELCAQLIVTPLPPGRPLWELLVVPGVAPGRIGLVLRLHHAIADGIGAVQIAQALMDSGRVETAPPLPPRTAGPVVQRSGLSAVLSGVTRTVTMFSRRVSPTVLLGPLGPNRTVAFVEVGLDALAAGAAVAGATVNDALLAAVAGATEAALVSRGERPPETLPVSVPVALPERSGSGNAVGVMIVDLPIGVTGIETRLRRVAVLTREAKADARSRGTFELTRTRIGARVFARAARHQRLVAGFVTNVRGPSLPLTLMGAPVESVWPLTAIQGNVRLGVSAISYAGILRCAVHCESRGVDARVLGGALERELNRIVALGDSCHHATGA